MHQLAPPENEERRPAGDRGGAHVLIATQANGTGTNGSTGEFHTAEQRDDFVAHVRLQFAAQYVQPAGAGVVGSAGADAIAGVDLRTFADVCRGLQAYNYDQAMAPTVAATKGITAEDWQTAMDGWNIRIKADPAIAQQFNAFYTGRA